MRCARPFKPRDTGLEFGCGQCMPCRINKSREWTSRITIEARLHDHNCFVTLTYDDAHLPPGRTLVKQHLQLFLKRLRKHYPPGHIRYFAVGEYGDHTQRPHYHLAIFGLDLLDEPNIASAWRDDQGRPQGFIKVDELNEGTAGYISQYVCKKWTRADDPRVREALAGRAPEFATMSLRPGIGAGAATIIGDAIANRATTVPTRLRMDGQLRPLGRYIRRKVRELAWNEEEIKAFETDVWLSRMRKEYEELKAQAEKAGVPLQKFLDEKRRQNFLNVVAKHKVRRKHRSL